MAETIIVTRHPGAVEFIRNAGYEGEVIEHFTPEMVEDGMIVVGVLPVHLIGEVLEKGGRYVHVVMPQIPQEMRGQELAPEQMREYGATLMEVVDLGFAEV